MVSLFALSTAPPIALQKTYCSKIREVSRPSHGSLEVYRYEVTVQDGTSGRPVWRKSFDNYLTSAWNRGHDRFAISFGWSIYHWSAGTQAKRIELPKLPYGFGEPPAYEDGLIWSPNSRFLLVFMRCTQGDGDFGNGAIFLVDASKMKSTILVQCGAQNPKWLPNGEIEYRADIFEDALGEYIEVYRQRVWPQVGERVLDHLEFSPPNDSSFRR